VRPNWALAVLVMLSSTAALAAEAGQTCRTSHNLVGACFSVHGRLFVANGTPSVRIFGIGTRRILGVLDRQSEAEGNEVIPPSVNALLEPDPFFIDVYGDYEVCPFDRTQLGRMQTVCIESASHLIAQRHQ
jgi:hypothetical protein